MESVTAAAVAAEYSDTAGLDTAGVIIGRRGKWGETMTDMVEGAADRSKEAGEGTYRKHQ